MLENEEEVIVSTDVPTVNDEPFIPPRDLNDISINFMWLRLMNAISEKITPAMLSMAKIGGHFL